MTTIATTAAANSNKFDVDKFNKSYDEMLKNKEIINQKKRDDLLNQLNTDKPKSITDQTIGEVLINTKDTIFDIFGDLLRPHRLSSNTLTKNNRLYYLGILCLLISLFILIYSSFTKLSQIQSQVQYGAYPV
jgi:hypothetical protein